MCLSPGLQFIPSGLHLMFAETMRTWPPQSDEMCPCSGGLARIAAWLPGERDYSYSYKNEPQTTKGPMRKDFKGHDLRAQNFWVGGLVMKRFRIAFSFAGEKTRLRRPGRRHSGRRRFGKLTKSSTTSITKPSFRAATSPSICRTFTKKRLTSSSGKTGSGAETLPREALALSDKAGPPRN